MQMELRFLLAGVWLLVVGCGVSEDKVCNAYLAGNAAGRELNYEVLMQSKSWDLGVSAEGAGQYLSKNLMPVNTLAGDCACPSAGRLATMSRPDAYMLGMREACESIMDAIGVDADCSNPPEMEEGGDTGGRWELDAGTSGIYGMSSEGVMASGTGDVCDSESFVETHGKTRYQALSVKELTNAKSVAINTVDYDRAVVCLIDEDDHLSCTKVVDFGESVASFSRVDLDGLSADETFSTLQFGSYEYEYQLCAQSSDMVSCWAADGFDSDTVRKDYMYTSFGFLSDDVCGINLDGHAQCQSPSASTGDAFGQFRGFSAEFVSPDSGYVSVSSGRSASIVCAVHSAGHVDCWSPSKMDEVEMAAGQFTPTSRLPGDDTIVWTGVSSDGYVYGLTQDGSIRFNNLLDQYQSDDFDRVWSNFTPESWRAPLSFQSVELRRGGYSVEACGLPKHQSGLICANLGSGQATLYEGDFREVSFNHYDEYIWVIPKSGVPSRIAVAQ
jgi:hypothetical protein